MAVFVAEDGPSARKVFQSQRPDLVVLDIGIPKMDGLGVCRRIKAHGYAPVILVTARDADEDIVRGFEVGAEEWLAKPVTGNVPGSPGHVAPSPNPVGTLMRPNDSEFH